MCLLIGTTFGLFLVIAILLLLWIEISVIKLLRFLRGGFLGDIRLTHKELLHVLCTNNLHFVFNTTCCWDRFCQCLSTDFCVQWKFCWPLRYQFSLASKTLLDQPRNTYVMSKLHLWGGMLYKHSTWWMLITCSTHRE